VPLSKHSAFRYSQGTHLRFFWIANVKLYTAGDDGSAMVIRAFIAEADAIKRASLAYKLMRRINLKPRQKQALKEFYFSVFPSVKPNRLKNSFTCP